jgi:hypothetical protein
MVVIVTLSGVMSTIVYMGMQRSFMAQKLSDRVRAVAIAEAGANEAYTVLVTNFNARSNAASFPKTKYGNDGGWYDATVVSVGDKKAIITSTGDCGYASASVIIDINNYGHPYGGNKNWDEDAFDYAILSGGNFDFGGSGNVAGTNETLKMHSNTEISIRGASDIAINLQSAVKITVGRVDISDVEITAPELRVHAQASVSNETIAAVDLIEVPEIDLTPYNKWAADNGEVYTPTNGMFEINSSTNFNGGIIWIEGDVTISGNPCVITGAIFATGDIIIAGGSGLDLTKDETGFALASRDGDIQVSASGNIEGLAYAKTGGYTQTANGNFQGQIIAAGGVRKGGNSDTMLYEKTIPIPPGGATWDDYPQLIGVSAWQK